MVDRLSSILGIALTIPIVGILTAAFAGVEQLGGGFIAANQALVVISFLGAILAFTLIGAQVGLAHWAGPRREALAMVFPALTRTSIVVMIAIVVLQTLALSISIYFWLAKLIGAISSPVIALAVAIAGGGAALGLIRAFSKAAEKPVIETSGMVVDETRAPGLHAHVRALADRIGAKAPDHIIVGLQPTFFVTSADVRLRDAAPLRGESLYLSAPLARLLTPGEFDAVIGHELGHFRGEDTRYSLHFAPSYAGLGRAMHGMFDSEGRIAWTALPALHMLGFLYELFAEPEAEVSRKRELEADRAGAEASSADAVATSLLKMAFFTDGYIESFADNAFLERARQAGGVTEYMVDGLRRDFAPWRWKETLAAALDGEAPHPIDTHPPTKARLAALGFDIRRVTAASLMPPRTTCGADLIDDRAAIEAALVDEELKDRTEAAVFGVNPVLARL